MKRVMRALAVFALVVPTRMAAAEDQPWAVGVSEDRKAEAKQLLDAGNALFLEKKYAEALAKYEQATKSWDHPAIRFNMVRCQIALLKYLEADENLKLALKYGAAPHEEQLYREAKNYENLLAAQVVDVEVVCSQPGVTLTLDGQPLGTCPTKQARRVAPGRHQVVGVKQGFLTKTEELFAVGGERKSVDVKLLPLERAAKIEHRWPTWMPWVVFGGGFAIAGVGGLVQLKALSDMRTYDSEVTALCDNGCPPDAMSPMRNMISQKAKDSKELAELESTIGIAVISVGVATVVTGSVLLYMNRGRTVYPKERAPVAPVAIVPTQGGAMATLLGRF